MTSNKLFAQVINNNGAAISVTNGTFVQGDTLENTAGSITNNGTIGLIGHYINIGTTSGDGTFNIQGNWTNTGVFNADFSTVNFNGSTIQRITSTGGETFYTLIINNNGVAINNRILLLSNVNISNSLNFNLGNIETGANTLYLTNQASNSLDYSSVTGSRIIGKFERGINAATNYLFPVGSDSNYNPLNLTPNVLTSGSVLSEFIATDPDSIGLPLPDAGYLNPADSVEVYNADSVGYWSLTAFNSFSTSDFDINLDGTGFTIPDQNVTRIIKRTAVGNWTLDGKHKDAINSIANRDTLTGGILTGTGHHYGWGHIRPRIQTQPADTAICDGESATFSIVATGRGTLTYTWEVLELSGGWQAITDGAIYANSKTDTLLIIAADTSMNGYKYRVIVRDSLENFHRSNAQATLTVNPRPVVTATSQQDTICNGATTHIELTSTEPGTIYAIEILNPLNNIDGDIMNLNGDTIEDILTNPTLFADSVVYRIVPYGPFSTQCEGTADTVVIWVEPTVQINAVNDTICNGNTTNILINSDNITTNGIYYTWIATATDLDVSGYSNNALGQDISTNLTQTLDNIGSDSAIVHYVITPWTLNASGNLACQGTPIDIDIYVEPTVVITASNDTLCNGADTDIQIFSASMNATTNGIHYTWTATATDPDVSGYSDNATGQDIATNLQETLNNIGTDSAIVHYTITPWTLNASGNLACLGTSFNVNIWVNPTPQVIITVLADTICNDTYSEITLTTPSILTSGLVTFDYNSVADVGLTGNSSDINLIHNDIIADSLHNASAMPATPLVVRYNITPRALSIGCADGSTRTDSITVHPTADIYRFADSVICYQESNGEASIIAENGINIFTYEWDNLFNQTDSLATGLPIGWYTVTVTDNQSCTKIDSVLIEQPDRLIPVIDTVRNVSCFGIGDAYIILTPTGGNGGNIYEWKDKDKILPSVIDSIGGLNGGDFYVTVTDWKGCTQDTTMEVDEPPQISMDILEHHITCNGENNGWAEVLVVGLDMYIWSTGDTTAKITNLSPGPYSVTAYNIEGCKSTESTEIKEPEVLEIESINSTRISCAGDDDGKINVIAKEGNVIDFFSTNNPQDSIDFPYTYNWFTPNGSGLDPIDNGSQTGLLVGTYYITVSDWQGCFANDSAIVQGPLSFESNTVTTDVTCFEDYDGSIDLKVIGGNIDSAYTFYWETNDGEGLDTISEDQTNLSGGDYFVTITDANDCELLDTAIIIEPDLLETFITETNISCFGYEDGAAKIDILGGNGGYVIAWSGNPTGQNTDSIYGLSAGVYNVTINDIENCLTTNSVEITQPEQIETIISSSNITCFGFNNGVISLNPTGGTIPYNYIWSHDGNLDTNIASNLWPGNYNIDILDANNCIEVSTVDITQPDRLEFDPTTYSDDITCYGEDNGYIFLNIGGGTPDYNYIWSTGSSGSTIDITSEDMLTAGMYHIDISDVQNCQIDTTIEIIEPEKLIITPVLRKPTCADISDGSIELNITGGRTQNNEYIIYWDNGSTEENLYDIRSGIYKVQISDSSSCAIDTTFRLRSAFAFCINIPSAFSPNGDNINEKWEIDMSLYPNAEIEIFDRFGKRIFFSKGYEESQYWDGSLNGKELPMDAYYYIIYLKNGSGRISGTVTLLR